MIHPICFFRATLMSKRNVEARDAMSLMSHDVYDCDLIHSKLFFLLNSSGYGLMIVQKNITQ